MSAERPRLERSHSEQPVSESPAPSSQPQPSLVLAPKSCSTAVIDAPPLRPARHPARANVAAQMTNKLAETNPQPRTATGSREDVTPWELYPAPDYPVQGTSAEPVPAQSSIRPSSSGGRPSGMHFPDGLVRRRKSTGAKTLKVKSATSSRPSVPPSPAVRSPHRSSTTPLNNANEYLMSTSAVYATPFLATLAPQPQSNTRAPPRTDSVSPSKQKEIDHQLKFSTADRTILEELKRNISARASQFVVKGGWAGCGKPGFGPGGCQGWGTGGLGAVGIMGGRKHHPFRKDEVPYPRSYERDVLDLDIWETAFCQQICDSMTWHVFDQPPKKVLDIGCGTGAWILNCARIWRDTSFVGLDVVPLHPDLHQVGSNHLAQRITWTQGNFLEFLPFPNEEFDYVHIKRIALGVPEDKWDHLFEEIIRVMKPGGAFEMIEEDLFFPGRPPDEAADDSDNGSDSELLKRNSATSDVTRSSDLDGAESDSTLPTSLYDSGIITRKSEDGPSSFPDASPSLRPSLSVPSLSSPMPILPSTIAPVSSTAIVEDDEEEKGNDNANGGTITQASHISRKSQKKMLSSLLPVNTDFSPKVLPSQKSYSGSTVSLHNNNASSLDAVVLEARGRTRRLSLAASTNSSYAYSPQSPSDFVQRTLRPPPFLARPRNAPMNPRDHTLLEAIYNEMQASRFINLSPLSLLPNLLSLHFSDVRSHPPLQFAFPPLQPRKPEKQDDSSLDDFDPDEEAKNAINPHPAKPPSVDKQLLTVDNSGDEDRWISAKDILHRASQFVSFDDSRFEGFSPRATSFPSKWPPTKKTASVEDPSAPKSTLLKNYFPNKVLNIDTRTVNLNLALRTAEILACSEEMWEWVIEYQEDLRLKKREEVSKSALRERSKSVDAFQACRNSFAGSKVLPLKDPNDPKTMIAELKREDFEALLSRFDMDMKDHMALGTQLEDRFSWSMFASPPSLDRKAFDAACERYQMWEEEERPKHNSRSRPTSMSVMMDEADTLNADHILVRGRAPHPHSSNPVHSQSYSISPSVPSITPKRLSRTIGVFVAWKPLGNPSGSEDN